MATILLATDAAWIADDVEAALGDADTDVVRVTSGHGVVPATREHQPELVILDLQIGSMGGMATCLEIRLEQGAGRLDPVPVVMLLDRPADVFLARRCEADGWLVKPLDAFRLRRAADAVRAGDTWEEPAHQAG